MDGGSLLVLQLLDGSTGTATSDCYCKSMDEKIVFNRDYDEPTRFRHLQKMFLTCGKRGTLQTWFMALTYTVQRRY
jgi:hypothetical protein